MNVHMLHVCGHIKHVVERIRVITSLVVKVPTYSLFTFEFLANFCRFSHCENGSFEVLSFHELRSTKFSIFEKSTVNRFPISVAMEPSLRDHIILNLVKVQCTLSGASTGFTFFQNMPANTLHDASIQHNKLLLLCFNLPMTIVTRSPLLNDIVSD